VAEPDPEGQLKDYAAALAAGVERALPVWVVRSIERRSTDVAPGEVNRAAAQAAAEVGGAVRRLLASDIDQQRTTPLALLRSAVRYPTEVLRQAGVPPVQRDRFAEEAFPDDVYDLTPATFADLDPDLAEPGLAWGAAKAFVHKRRHAG
jgi:hypothetical protein